MQVQPTRLFAEVTGNHQTQTNTKQDANATENDRLTRLENLVENLALQLNKVTERMDQMLTILVNITSKKP